MKLSFHTRHRSIKALDEIDLPEFTLLVGLNGSGKSHLLDAVIKGAVKVHIDGQVVSEEDVQMISFRDVTLQNVNQYDVEAFAQQRRSFLEVRPKVREIAISSVTAMYEQYGIEASFTDDSPLSTVPDIFLSAIPVDELAGFQSMLLDHCMSFAGHFDQISYELGRNAEANHFQDRIGRPLIDLTESELQWTNPLLSKDVPLMENSFSELFGNYRKHQERNQYYTFRNVQYGGNYEVLSEQEFVDVLGFPPWDVANDLLKSAEIPVRFEVPPEIIDGPYTAKILHSESGDPIPLTDLSSGEQVLMTLTMAIWGKSDKRHAAKLPKVLLLDEVDAPLHASMIRSFVAMIRETLVAEFGVRVVLATHSASTVAISGEGTIYERRANDPRLYSISSDEAIRNLVSGIPTLSVKVENRRPVFVESDNDVRYYELLMEAFSEYLTDQPFNLNFMSTSSRKGSGDLTGCERVISIVKKLNEVGVDQVRGLIDRDTRGKPPKGLFLLGGDERYAIENFVLDPLMVGLFLVKMKYFSRISLRDFGLSDERGNWGGFTKDDLDSLQGIADGVLKKTGLNSGPTKTIELVGGMSVEVSKCFCDHNGHDWEELLKNKFPELKRFTKQAQLKSTVIMHVWMTFPSLAPVSIFTTLKELAS